MDTNPKKGVLAIDALTIYNAEELQRAFADVLLKCQHLDVDLSEVTEIDCAGLQIMVALKKSAKQLGKTIVFLAHSQEVIDFLNLLNMTEYFGDPIIIGKV